MSNVGSLPTPAAASVPAGTASKAKSSKAKSSRDSPRNFASPPHAHRHPVSFK